jgi:hypothetical protein
MKALLSEAPKRKLRFEIKENRVQNLEASRTAGTKNYRD